MIDKLARRYLQAANLAGKPALVHTAAQALFDALWHAGYRPMDRQPDLPLERAENGAITVIARAALHLSEPVAMSPPLNGSNRREQLESGKLEECLGVRGQAPSRL